MKGEPKVLVVGCGPVDTNKAREALSRPATPSPEVTEQMVEESLQSFCLKVAEEIRQKLFALGGYREQPTLFKMDEVANVILCNVRTQTANLSQQNAELLAANGLLTSAIKGVLPLLQYRFNQDQLELARMCIEELTVALQPATARNLVEELRECKEALENDVCFHCCRTKAAHWEEKYCNNNFKTSHQFTPRLQRIIANKALTGTKKETT